MRKISMNWLVYVGKWQFYASGFVSFLPIWIKIFNKICWWLVFLIHLKFTPSNSLSLSSLEKLYHLVSNFILKNTHNSMTSSPTGAILLCNPWLRFLLDWKVKWKWWWYQENDLTYGWHCFTRPYTSTYVY